MELTDAISRRLAEQTAASHGMMPPSVYRAICLAAGNLKGTQIVEIGTAHGAATIAMAIGLQAAGSEAIIQTVDAMSGRFSSRPAFGSIADNEQILRVNLERAGVARYVELFIGTSDEFVASGKCPPAIDLLMLDADGRIDRDLEYFYPRMSPGSPIIIRDDADANIHLNRNADGLPYHDLKHRITSLLLEGYREAGYLIVDRILECTAFCRRGDLAYDAAGFRKIMVGSYHQLVFSGTRQALWSELQDWSRKPDEIREALAIRKKIPRHALAMARWIMRFQRRVSARLRRLSV